MKFIGSRQELKLFQQHSIYLEVVPQEDSKVKINKVNDYVLLTKYAVIPF